MDGGDAALALATRVARLLGEVPEVAGVVLGGSHATGTAGIGSDIDLGIYYHADAAPSISRLRALAVELGNVTESVTAIGEWGPWINGGAWLEVEGQRVDWLYREIERVQTVIDRCRVGETAFHYQPGHPFAFADHIYMGEVHVCHPLHDPREEIAQLKALTMPYPAPLKRKLIGTLWEAEFALDNARKAATRADAYYVAGCFVRCASILVQVVFALNERYWLNEKGSVATAGTLPLSPSGFSAIIERAFSAPGSSADELTASIESLERLTEAVREMSEGSATA